MSPCRNSARSGLTMIEVLIIVAIVLVIAAIAVPGLLSSKRASNERGSSTTLKTVSSAQADFRANDRDWNGVHDFWTADVKGLYTMTAANVRGGGSDPKDPAIKLIELPLAAADADESHVHAAGENMPLASFTVPSAKAGYWYAALIADHSEGAAKAVLYKEDTGGVPPMGKCHNLSRFGVVAFADRPASGKYTFIVNENNTIIRIPATGSVRRGTANPPGSGGIAPELLNWPEDKVLMNPKWSD